MSDKGFYYDLKQKLSEILYVIFEEHLLKGQIKVHTVDETIDELLNTEKSLVRFGDGDMNLISGAKNHVRQVRNPELQARMRKIIKFEDENLMVAINGIFDGMKDMTPRGKSFWVRFLLKGRRYYHTYLDKSKTYYNTFFTRFYFCFADKKRSEGWIARIRMIFKDRKLLVIEGVGSHNGVGNDLFSEAKEVRRIICPPSNAYFAYDKILAAARTYDKSYYVIISLGATTKPLCEDLYHDGYRVLDLGNIDVEYEWCLNHEIDKTDVPKYQIMTEEENRAAGYDEYLSQIDMRIVND